MKNLHQQTIQSLLARIQSAVKRSEELCSELCPSPTRMRVADDVTALVDLMTADAVEMLSSASHALSQVKAKLEATGDVEKLSAVDVALVARAKQKVDNSVDLLNKAQLMIDGEMTIWCEELRHGSLYYK